MTGHLSPIRAYDEPSALEGSDVEGESASGRTLDLGLALPTRLSAGRLSVSYRKKARRMEADGGPMFAVHRRARRGRRERASC
ncbi:MAG: hypothetical protein ACLP8S_00855 [Solirubrobacteraceae bacterium]